MSQKPPQTGAAILIMHETSYTNDYGFQFEIVTLVVILLCNGGQIVLSRG